MYNKTNMQDAKEEIRSRLNIEDVVGEYVPLKKAGRNFKALSPFTNERTPSFYVSPEKQIWHDFSSGKGGDVYSFVMEVEGLDFRGALELLARKAGVDLGLYGGAPDGRLAQKKRRLLKLLDLAATYYQQSLVKNRRAQEYVFKKRGLNKPAVAAFRIGYAPMASDGLARALAKLGYKAQEMQEAGLVSLRRGRPVDMFRGRMMLPLYDFAGQVVGFTARLISDEPEAPKYINTPKTLLYDKGRQVFGLHLAKEAIRKTGKAVVVEGNLDVVSSFQFGVKNVVAAAGTALTEHHLKTLARLTVDVVLAFDADEAGLKATERAIDLAQRSGVNLSVASLPAGAKDPDELVRRDPAAWQTAIDGAEPAVDWTINLYKRLYDLGTAAGKRELTGRALNLINKLADPVEQEHYRKALADLTGASLEALDAKAVKLDAAPPRRLKAVKTPAAPAAAPEQAYQDSLLALALEDTGSREALRNVSPEELTGQQRQAVLRYLKNHPKKIIESAPTALQSYDTYVKILLLYGETRYAAWSSRDKYFEAVELVNKLKKDQKHAKKQQLDHQLRDAQERGDAPEVRRLIKQLNAIIKEFKDADK